jgi:hypothetical protein
MVLTYIYFVSCMVHYDLCIFQIYPSWGHGLICEAKLLHDCECIGIHCNHIIKNIVLGSIAFFNTLRAGGVLVLRGLSRQLSGQSTRTP